jgi:hypothetical protein
MYVISNDEAQQGDRVHPAARKVAGLKPLIMIAPGRG